MTNLQIQKGEEYLAHHGVLGMKWGHHQLAKAVVLGMYGNKKKYSDPEALKKRTQRKPSSRYQLIDISLCRKEVTCSGIYA